jgi:hypothetical protein
VPPHTNFELQLAVADVRKFADLLPLICKQKETLNAAIAKYMTQPKQDTDAPEPRTKRPEPNVRSKFNSHVYAAFERRLEKPIANEEIAKEETAEQETSAEKPESEKTVDRRSLASAAVVGTAAATTVALAVVTGCAAVRAQEATGEIKRLQDSGQLLRMMQDKNAAQRKLAAQTMTRVMGVDYSVDAAAVQSPEVAAELLGSIAEIDRTSAAKAAEKLVAIGEREIEAGNIESAQLQCSKLHSLLGFCPADRLAFFTAKFNLLQTRILKHQGNLRRAKYAALRAIDNLSKFEANQQLSCEIYFEAGELMRLLESDDSGEAHLKKALTYTGSNPEARAKILKSLAYISASRQANLDAQNKLNEALTALKDESYGLERAEIYDAMAEVELRSGSPDGAYARYKQALVERRLASGTASAEAIATMHKMAELLIEQEQFVEAGAIVEESLDLLSEGSPQTGRLAAGLELKARLLDASGKLNDAIPVYKASLAAFQLQSENGSGKPLNVLKSIAAIQEKTDQPTAAIRSYRQIITYLQTHDSLDDSYVEAVDHLADLYRDQRLWRKSEQTYQSALFELNLCPQGSGNQKASLLQEYGKHFASVGRFADAVEQYQGALQTIRSENTDFSTEKLGSLYDDFNRAVRHLPLAQQKERQLSQLHPPS